MERELVKIASDVHSCGYYTQFKDMMKPGDKVFAEGRQSEEKIQRDEDPDDQKPVRKKKKK